MKSKLFEKIGIAGMDLGIILLVLLLLLVIAFNYNASVTIE